MPDPLARLIDGFNRFRATYFVGAPLLYDRLAREGQAPKVLVVACSDSRVDPAILTTAEPGDLFIVRNVAAIVPPYDNDGRIKGTSSAIEFAVRALEVEHVIVLGHAQCGGVRALAGDADTRGRFEFLSDWVNVATPARQIIDDVLAGGDAALRLRALEQATILVSLRNLLTFPWIAERVQAEKLRLHAWYFDLVIGRLLAHDAASGRFLPVEEGPMPIVGPCDCAQVHAGSYVCVSTTGEVTSRLTRKTG